MRMFSHNTMTYLKPKQWWLRPFFWLARCQRHTYIEQIMLGARYIDIRVSKCEDGIEYNHTVFKYDGSNFYEVMDYARECDILIRITLERGDTFDDVFWFRQLCRQLEDRGNRLCGGCARQIGWNVIYECKEQMPKVVEAYSSQTAWWSKRYPWLDDWCPWLYAKFHNAKIRKQYENTDKVVMMDFI